MDGQNGKMTAEVISQAAATADVQSGLEKVTDSAKIIRYGCVVDTWRSRRCPRRLLPWQT
ncbi:hypothetical protein [Halochromatium roseum]|uniref:hypothetical protein n=1 Tax=Halochromatium roseum TaxID=391920 RepID=UPI0019142CE0|nr:hypothetical protein [Halochromatium roseum]MBK5939239.1 hypothetical protein [Halochromatium roseum]